MTKKLIARRAINARSLFGSFIASATAKSNPKLCDKDVRRLYCLHDRVPQQALLALSSAVTSILTGICIHLHAPKQSHQDRPHRPQLTQLRISAFATT